jgi:hypothetical protein
MISQAQPQLSSAAAAPAPLQAFFDRVLSVNPFTDNRVNGPAPNAVDVDAIHQAEFERLTALAREARDQGRGIGAVLWGEAGIGKSHLLARLARWAERDGQACFVYLHNLQASPANLPRSLLKAVVSTLIQGQSGNLNRTPLFKLMYAAVREAVHHDTSRVHPWSAVERAFGRLIDGLSAHEPTRATLVDRQAYHVLFRFFQAACRTEETRNDALAALAVRWLSGDYLDAAEARLLGLPPGPRRDDPVALADNQQIKQVLVALSQLAVYRRQPFLLCLDQVDNLDEDQVAALARFLEALIDSAANLLAVTAGVQATLVGYHQRGVIQASAWDRLAQFDVRLQRIGTAGARQILSARLRHFLEPFRHLEAVQQQAQHDPLFPLGEAWAQAAFQDRIELRPRSVLNEARAGWQQEQEAQRAGGGPTWLAEWGRPSGRAANGPAPPEPGVKQIEEVIDRKVEQKLAEHRALRQAEPHTLPADGDNLSGLVQALLEQCQRVGPLHGRLEVERLPHPRYGPRPAFDLLVRHRSGEGNQETRVGLLFLTTASGQSATACLRRLLEDDRPLEYVLLITDQRQPMPLGNKGEEYLAELRRGGRFRHVELSFADYAGLDALQAVVGLARSGDLEVEEAPGKTRRLSEREVMESHQRRERYLRAAVLRDLLAADAPSRSTIPETPAPAAS